VAATSYRVLCGVLGAALLLGGLGLFASFFGYHAPASESPIPTGPVGYYWVATSGCAFVAWGGCLLAAARRPEGGRAAGTWSALGLVMLALMRMVAWIVGDYYVWPGELARTESVVFLLLALAFVWLRPAPTDLRPAPVALEQA
jgi:hypothetical protein